MGQLFIIVSIILFVTGCLIVFYKENIWSELVNSKYLRNYRLNYGIIIKNCLKYGYYNFLILRYESGLAVWI